MAPRLVAWAGAALLLAGCVTTQPSDPYLLGGRLPDLAGLSFTDADAALTTRPAVVPAEDGEPVQDGTVAPAPATVIAQAATRPAPAALPEGGDMWSRLQASNLIAPLPDELAGALIRDYASRPDFLARAMQRSAPYLHHIVDALERQGLPAELALLPVIESGFDPRALSPAAASGIWQFIPETGRRYGLRQDWLRDERRDPLAATGAALSYLSDLYRRFGDWHLALAAYNCGEGCVARAIDRARANGRTPDFVGILPWLPTETQGYVPRFVAVRTIFRNPVAHGVALPAPSRSQRIVLQQLDRDADLATVARLAGAAEDDIAMLNAGVLRQVVAGDGRHLWLTELQARRLRAALAAAPDNAPASLLRLKAVEARPSEPLGAFAARHNIDVARLRSINAIPASLSTIRSGTLFVPMQVAETSPLVLASLSPLRMQGEEELQRQRQSLTATASRDEALMAQHPEWVESGWSPDRLQLPGLRRRR
ncbi:MAG: transglycosylase SLT domain-containing protein [Burkholderiales bacterium]|nr:transglycosylase SLT domain-containing protein [Burkholderiales bacterium]